VRHPKCHRIHTYTTVGRRCDSIETQPNLGYDETKQRGNTHDEKIDEKIFLWVLTVSTSPYSLNIRHVLIDLDRSGLLEILDTM